MRALLLVALLLPTAALADPDSYSYERESGGSVVAAPSSTWTARFGLGVRGSTSLVDSATTLGVGGELLYRISSHFSAELAGEYQRNLDDTGGVRSDVPLTLGVRVHLGKPGWIASPYFVAAGGAGWARLELAENLRQAIYLDGQLGAGLEFRIGQHVALTADARLDARYFTWGDPKLPAADGLGVQFRAGFAAYF